MGATCVLPQKLGISLEMEMMLSASNYRGEELQQRGIRFPALPSMVAQEVAMHAVTFAQPEVKSRIATLFGN